MAWPHSVSVVCRDRRLSGRGALMDGGLCLLAPPLVGGASVWGDHSPWKGRGRGHLLPCFHGSGGLEPAEACPAALGWLVDPPAHLHWPVNWREADSETHWLLQTQTETETVETNRLGTGALKMQHLSSANHHHMLAVGYFFSFCFCNILWQSLSMMDRLINFRTWI